jgi:hypothetical protein
LPTRIDEQTAEATQLADLLKDAARQRRFMLPWQSDRRLVAAGGMVLYTVDVDVINLYINPEETAVATSRRREGYAQVFHGDPGPLSVALGRRLAQKLFFQLGPLPLLVLPPLDEEVRAVFRAVVDQAQDEQMRARSRLAELKTKVAELSMIEDSRDLARQLEEEALELATLVSAGGTATSELRRFSGLMDKGRIMPLDEAWEARLIEDPAFQQACTPPNGFMEWLRLHEFSDAWKARLEKTKAPERKGKLLLHDAEALARLEWVNGQLDGEQHRRVVLITGDTALERAAHGYRRDGDEHDFADLYLRHPRAFLGETDVLDAGDEDPAGVETELTLWLDALLARAQVASRPYRKSLDKLLSLSERERTDLARPIIASNAGIIEDILRRWSRFTRSLMLAQGVIDDAAAVGELADLRGDLQRLLDGVDKLLRNRVRETWWQTLGVTSRAGYALIFTGDPNRLPARNPPILSYDSFPQAEALAHLLVLTRRWDADAYREALEILDEEDTSSYTYFLALATLFAAEGVWTVAAGLAGEAIGIAEAHRPERISGREAAYVRAVALRHSARHVRELTAAGRELDDALRCLQTDREKRGHWYDAGEVRFHAERLALYLTYHLFDRFLDQPPPRGADVPDLTRLQEQFADLLARVDESQARPLIKEVTKRAVLINLIQTALLRWDKEGASAQRPELRSELEILESSIKGKEESIRVTFRAQAILSVARWWLEEDKARKREMRRAVERLLTDSAIREHAVLPYDQIRYRWLRDLVKPRN